jgi:hypothetical protein
MKIVPAKDLAYPLKPCPQCRDRAQRLLVARNRPVLLDDDGSAYCEPHACAAAPLFATTLAAYESYTGQLRELCRNGAITHEAMRDYFEMIGDLARTE